MSVTPTTCWHCGEALLIGRALHSHIAGESRAMCCEGCRAAAEWIEQLGLADFYRLRARSNAKPAGRTTNSDLWRRPENARHVVRDLSDGQHEVLLAIAGIRCSACAWLIERVLTALPGVVAVQVSPSSQRIRIIWRDSTDLPTLLGALERSGYSAMPLDVHQLHDARRAESRDALKRLLVAGFGAMQAMMYATAVYLGSVDSLDASTRGLLRWLQFLVAIPVVFYAARTFFVGAGRSLRARQLNMDVPIACAIAVVCIASLFETLRNGGEVYFDSITMFVFLLLAGRYLEMRARHHAGELTDALARLAPAYADRYLDERRFERVAAHELRVGDCVHVGDGAIVPADGVLLSEHCRVDEALFTGESAAVIKRRGDRLVAGSALEDGPAKLRIERIGADTALACMARLVADAQTRRPHLQSAGDRAASRFVARVLSLAAFTIIAWCFVDPSRAFPAALAVLVVSCPCAFALAVSAAFTRALATLAQHGILVARPDGIESLAGVTHAVFDKTGTLTQPSAAIADIDTFRGCSKSEALQLAASLARHSRHPIARVIAALEPRIDGSEAHGVMVHTGLGISGRISGRALRLGRSDFALGRGHVPAASEDDLLLTDEHGVLAAFHLREQLRPDTASAVDTLRSQGLSVLIASGDSATKVRATAERLRIADWRARLSPSQKLDWLRDLRGKGARVLVVGDGVNDAPVLTGADVGIALAEGAELAQASSDIVLSNARLDSIASARVVAQQTLAIVQQNQRWAVLYNVMAVPLAALGFVPPWLAAIGMSVSSLAVVLNTLRIRWPDAITRTSTTAASPSIAQRARTA